MVGGDPDWWGDKIDSCFRIRETSPGDGPARLTLTLTLRVEER